MQYYIIEKVTNNNGLFEYTDIGYVTTIEDVEATAESYNELQAWINNKYSASEFDGFPCYISRHSIIGTSSPDVKLITDINNPEA